MALFSQHPPGIQVKRWLIILTVMLILVDAIAAVNLFMVTNLMNAVVSRYQPMVIYSGNIASSICRVHTGLYQYLAEYRRDTMDLLDEVANLRKTIEEASRLPAAADLGADLGEIDTVLEKYGKVIQMLPKIGTTTNWSEVEELKNQAVSLGEKVEELAAKMKEHSYAQINEQAARSRLFSSIAMYVFIAFFALSLFMVVLLFAWWKDFQEMILKL